jgi:hypothetical protein
MGIGPADKTGQEALLSDDPYLLRQVGDFFYGGEWQAPLSRDLRVSERTMRRWVAGTEEVPRGVWRDLGTHMEIYDQQLGRLLAEVRRMSGLIKVCSFKAWDAGANNMVQGPGKSTAERIARIGGEIVPGTDEWVEPSTIDADGRMCKPTTAQEGLNQMTKACPLGDHVFRGNGWDGIDAHWRAKHDHLMPYEKAWPLIEAGTFPGPIHVEAGAPATLRYLGKEVRCPTLQEAAMAWHRLPIEEQARAAIQVEGGPLYSPLEIARLHIGP